MKSFSRFLFCLIFLVPLASFAKSDELLRVQISSDPYSLDPALTTELVSYNLLKNMMDGLYRLDREGNLQPALAEAHTVSKNGLIYKFSLRKSARWSDGQPVQVPELIAGFTRALDPKVGAPNADLLDAIKNAREIRQGKKPMAALGVREEGGQLVIELERPDASLLQVLTMPIVMPVRKEHLSEDPRKWNPLGPTTGRFKLTSLKSDKELRLEPNPHHPNPAKRKILFQVLPEEATALSLFESGHLDVLSGVTLTEVERLRAKGLIRQFPSTVVAYMSFNTIRAPTSDRDFRDAVAGAMDRDGTVKVLGSAFQPVTSFVPNGIEGYKSFEKVDRKSSMEKLRARAEKPRLKFAYGAAAVNDMVMQKIQNDLKTKLSIEVELQPLEWKTFLGRLKSDPPDVYFMGLGAPYADPMYHLSNFSSGQSAGYSRYNNPAYDSLLEEIKKTPSGKRRKELAEKAQTILIEKDAVVIPVFSRAQVFGVGKDVKDFAVNPHGIMEF